MDFLEVENTCRICMLSDCELVGIFEERDGRAINELIEEMSGVNIERSDLLSKKVCKDCEAKVIAFHEFRQLCIDSDETVRYNLLLADGSDSTDLHDIISDVSLKKDDLPIEEYFIEDNSVEDGQTEYQRDDDTMEYEEQFVKDGEEIEEHQIFASVETSDDENIETIDTTDNHNIVVIERVDTRSNANSSIIHEPSEDLAEKMRLAHFAKEQQKKHKCPHCDKFFMFPSKVNRHVIAVHKNSSSPKKEIKKNHHCSICDKAFVSQFKVRRHMIVHDTELKMGLQKNWSRNYFSCEACHKKFHTPTTFDRHKLICEMLQKSSIERSNNHEYLCVVCALVFRAHDEMVEHMKTSHTEHESYTCVICPSVSHPINEMIRHGKYHEQNVTYSCCVCQKMYPNGEEIVTHLLRHKEYKPFSCRQCGKSFFEKYKLRQHLNTHNPNVAKNFVCEFCQRAFAAQDYLNCHLRRKHSDVKPYLCNFCTKSFAFAHDLNLHVSNHTGEKKHICVICDASFTKAWSLKQHLTLHETNPSGLRCNICDFTASSKSRLQQHLAAHTEQQSPQNSLDEENFTFMENVSEDADEDNYNLEEIQTTY